MFQFLPLNSAASSPVATIRLAEFTIRLAEFTIRLAEFRIAVELAHVQIVVKAFAL